MGAGFAGRVNGAGGDACLGGVGMLSDISGSYTHLLGVFINQRLHT